MLFYHNEQGSHDTCSTMQASVPLPNGGQESLAPFLIQLFFADSPNMRNVLILHRRFTGRIVIALVQAQMCGESCVVSGRSTTIASIVASSNLVSCTFAAATIAASGPPSASTRNCVCRQFPPVRGVWPDLVPPNRALLIAVSATAISNPCRRVPRSPRSAPPRSLEQPPVSHR